MRGQTIRAVRSLFFGISQGKAESLTHTHRCCSRTWPGRRSTWAGYGAMNSSTKRFALWGRHDQHYLCDKSIADDELVGSLEPVQINIGNGGDFLHRVPSANLRSEPFVQMPVTSLTAVHLACQSYGMNDMALALRRRINQC